MKKALLGIAGVVLMIVNGFAHAGEKQLFYIHGCCINKIGSDGCEGIVKDLKGSGFNVVFDLRTDDSDGEVKSYAAKVADQVKGLLAKGTAPEDITVSGYSLGSVTTMYAAAAIANPKVNYVLFAGCPGPAARRFDLDYSKVQGRVLSVIDVKDDRFGSCKENLPASVLQKEVALDSGQGHQVFRFADERSIKLWKDPLVEWSKGK